MTNGSSVKKIALLVGQNAYGTTRWFTQGLADAFEFLNIQCRQFFLTDIHQYTRVFQEVAAFSPDATCSFSDITFGNKQPVADFFNLPHLCLLIDPAIYFLHQTRSKHSLISYVDMHDADVIKQFQERHLFLPHGGDPRYLYAAEAERPYDAVFFGSCIDFEAIRQSWKSKYSAPAQKILERTVEKVLSNSTQSLCYHLMESMHDCGVSFDTVNVPLLHQEADLYIRGKDRYELLKALNHLKIHIWGDATGGRTWADYLSGCSNVEIHPAVDFGTSLSIMQKSKVVLNSSIRFKHGSHERIFYGALCGAAVLTNDTPYARQNFEVGKEILTYVPGQWTDANEQLKAISSLNLQEIATWGQQKVLQNHTWVHRAEALLSNFFNS